MLSEIFWIQTTYGAIAILLLIGDSVPFDSY